MKTLFLSPLQPQNAGGVGGGGGRGGTPASFPSRSPPPKQPFQPTPTPSPGSHQEVCEKIVIKPWGPGPSPVETWPTGPWGLDPATLTDFLQAKFSTSCCVSNPNPLGVGWFPKAELYSSMRGGVPVFARWAGPQASPPTLGGVLDGYSPKTRWGGGGRGGTPASFPSRSPPPKQPFQPTPTPSPGSHQEVCEKIVI